MGRGAQLVEDEEEMTDAVVSSLFEFLVYVTYLPVRLVRLAWYGRDDEGLW